MSRRFPLVMYEIGIRAYIMLLGELGALASQPVHEDL